jgi:hypothetical protein
MPTMSRELKERPAMIKESDLKLLQSTPVE